VQLDEALLTASAFSNMLNLHNLSEEVANSERERLQRLGEVARGPVKTTNGTLETLLDAGIPAATIYKSLCDQTVDLVFTAHPTQALRRSMLKNFQATRSELDRLHRTRLTRYERLEVQGSIRAHVQAARPRRRVHAQREQRRRRRVPPGAARRRWRQQPCGGHVAVSD
jgi:phosphoenolpyruvate carboxylase